MLHFAVNRPIGATRGESDLLPVLPWAKRYSEWLKDRVRLNRIRTRQAIMHLKIADPAMVEKKRQQLRTDNPIESGIYVSGPDEEMIVSSLAIQAGDAQDDGRALRLAIAGGGNVGLHYLGEGETVNYATAREMGEPTSRFYADRQQELINALTDLVAAAYNRWAATNGRPHQAVEDLQLQTSATEVARADNESLAKAARDVVEALAQMKAQGWIDDATAASLAFKFAGEPLGQQEIEDILANVTPQQQQQEKPNEPAS
jgi:predicted transcriptional regulator